MASIKQDIADEQASFRTDLTTERKAFTQDMAKLHEVHLSDLDRKDSRLSVPPYIIYVVIILLILLAIHFGATLIAILTNILTSRMTTITVIFLGGMILLPALIIYLHRQEYL